MSIYVILIAIGTFQMSNTNTSTYFFQPSLVKMLSVKNVKMFGLGKNVKSILREKIVLNFLVVSSYTNLYIYCGAYTKYQNYFH